MTNNSVRIIATLISTREGKIPPTNKALKWPNLDVMKAAVTRHIILRTWNGGRVFGVVRDKIFGCWEIFRGNDNTENVYAFFWNIGNGQQHEKLPHVGATWLGLFPAV
jgi:hypothetical protein